MALTEERKVGNLKINTPGFNLETVVKCQKSCSNYTVAEYISRSWHGVRIDRSAVLDEV